MRQMAERCMHRSVSRTCATAFGARMRPRPDGTCAVRHHPYIARMSEDTLRRAVAEMIGAFTLTFIGAGAAAAAGGISRPLADRRGDRQRSRDRRDGVRARAHLRRALQPGDHVRLPDHPPDQAGARGRLLGRAIRRRGAGGAARQATAATRNNRSGQTRRAGARTWRRRELGLLLEAILTFFLVLVVFGAAVDERGPFSAVADWRSA